ncbi:MAG: putative Ig domain-containing protein [Actinobacteria bacterium]|nr:putative Ig domain-containing protein [Actinomycetota bacterium]
MHRQDFSRRRGRGVAVSAAALMVAALALTVPSSPAAAFGSSAPPSVPSVSAGGFMTCGVRSDMTAACWGDNASEGPSATPPAGVTFLEVNAGHNTGCGITTANAVVCWGNNNFGKVTGVPAGTFSHVAAGLDFVCALTTAGNPVCWGANDAGQVANTPTAETFTQLTVGIRHACGLRSNGTILCWGSNIDGQLNVPAGTYTAVNSGNFTVCAIRTDGTVVCWGRNNAGQPTVPTGTFTQISTGFGHVCGLRPDNTITCWGRNAEGQTVAPEGTYTHVSAGTFHSCAMPTTGPPAVCWGNNAAGRVQPNLSAAAPPDGTVGTPYNFAFLMTTHVSPSPTFIVTTGGLPPGLTLSPSGVLSGTPTTPGSYNFRVTATNGLSPPDCPAFATGSLPCFPGDPTSPTTATRTYTIVITGGGATTTASPATLEPGDSFTTSASGLASPNSSYRLKLASSAATCHQSTTFLGGAVNSDANGNIGPVTRVIPVNATSGAKVVCWVRVGDNTNGASPATITVV